MFARDILLKDKSYYQTGGRCAYYYEPACLSELSDALKEISSKNLDFFIFGAASNSLLSDDYWPGAVLSCRALKALRLEEERIYVEAGVENSQLAQFALDNGLSGLEWMYRLPGQLGATARMNARCYGGEISEHVVKIYAYSLRGELRVYNNSPSSKLLFRSYKDTVFMENGEIIAALELSHVCVGEKVSIESKMRGFEADRIAKAQFVYPSCGCVFKNDYNIGVPSGMLLEHANVATLNTSKVSVNEKHANFVFNRGASSKEILEFTFAMQEKVWEVFGVWLQYEMEVLGSLGASHYSRLKEKREHQVNESKLATLRELFHARR